MIKGPFYGLGKSIMPERIRIHIGRYLSKAGYTEVPFNTYGLIFILTLVATVAAYPFVLFPILSKTNLLFLVGGSFIILTLTELILVIIIGFIFWIYYEFVIFMRTMKIEEVLPDFLEEVSVNLRAGMSFDKALWNSVEPEFGVLEREIEIVAKKVMSGYDTEDALREFSKKYNSTLLQESMDMIIVGLESGGNIAELIDRIVENVKQAYLLRKEMIASITSYIIFISATAVVISPVLFALSFNLMQIIQGLSEKLTVTGYGTLPLGLSRGRINPRDFINFSKVSIIVISSISSIIIADLREGSIRAGLKYLFLFIPMSYLIYILALNLFIGLFGMSV